MYYYLGINREWSFTTSLNQADKLTTGQLRAHTGAIRLKNPHKSQTYDFVRL